jgi:hypothetical protein
MRFAQNLAEKISASHPEILAMPKRFILAIALCCPLLASAADLDAGIAAYEKRDYATALREFRPLAEQGNAGALARGSPSGLPAGRCMAWVSAVSVARGDRPAQGIDNDLGCTVRPKRGG